MSVPIEKTRCPIRAFLDLVYVFAVTQVTHFMEEAHSAYGIVQGLLLPARLW